MFNLLLNSSNNISIAAVIILFVLMIIAVVVFIIVKKKFSYKPEEDKDNLETIDLYKSMGLRIPFLNNSELKFFNAFKNVLPDEYVIYPKLTLETIIVPYNNMQLYNAIKDKTIDFAIFMKVNMQPIAIVDILDGTGELASIADDDKLMFAALENVNLPIIEYEIKQEYEPVLLLEKFLDVLDPYQIAELRKKRMK